MTEFITREEWELIESRMWADSITEKEIECEVIRD
jgi:hypothetical protein